MPQMAPLMWTCLFLMFVSLLLMSIVKISFMKKESSLTAMENNMHGAAQKKLNWKW